MDPQHVPTTRETQVQSLGREDPPVKAMAPHSSTLAWKIPRTEKPGYSPWGRKESDTTERRHFHLNMSKIIPFNMQSIHKFLR